MRAHAERRFVYHVFDVPWLNGEDLTRRRLTDRKSLLAETIRGARTEIPFTDRIVGNGAEAFARADALDLEGIVSKRIYSAYYPGVRSHDWQKAKCWRTLTVTIGGVVFDHDGHIEGLLAGTLTGEGLRFEGLVEFGLSRIGNLRELIIV
jgi:bifunctional non-homologous end joining protein LigD